MNIPFSYDSAASIAEFLSQSGLHPSKRFGQNFLISPQARSIIVDLLQLEPEGQEVWEIGPGLGAMTAKLLDLGHRLTVFEIDHGFCSLLRSLFGSVSGFTLVEGDFLKTWKEHLRLHGAPVRIAGNLPYNVGSVMIAQLIEQRLLPERMVFTLQKEVAQRAAARPGTKIYAAFSILCTIDYEVRCAADLKPGNFYPRPDVDSSVVVFSKRAEPLVPLKQRSLFLEVTRDLFSMRRKTVKNNLLQGRCGRQAGSSGVEKILKEADISPSMRGETLTISQILEITRLLGSLQG